MFNARVGKREGREEREEETVGREERERERGGQLNFMKQQLLVRLIFISWFNLIPFSTRFLNHIPHNISLKRIMYIMIETSERNIHNILKMTCRTYKEL